jgi:hypothetical protein
MLAYPDQTPFANTLAFPFIADEMMVEMRGSVSLEASDTLLLTEKLEVFGTPAT